jgi:hypothetical protein
MMSAVIASQARRSNGLREPAPLDGRAWLAMTENEPPSMQYLPQE